VDQGRSARTVRSRCGYRMFASAPPFRAVVKADAGVRAAGERALDRTLLLLDVLPIRHQYRARLPVLGDHRRLVEVERSVDPPPQVSPDLADTHACLVHSATRYTDTRVYTVAMQADTARKYRAYPTTEQADRLTGWGHTCRAIWNVALEQRQWLYDQHRVTLNAIDQSRELTAARAEIEWLADLPAQAGQQVLRHLDQAYKNFWNLNHPAAFPTRRKRGGRLTVSLPGQAIAVRRLNKRWGAVRVPKLGEIRLRWSRNLDGTVRNVTISRDGLGWHVAFGIASGCEPKTTHDQPGTPVGLDRGVVCAVADSDGGLHNAVFISDRELAAKVALERRRARQETTRKRAVARTSNRARLVHNRLAKISARTARRRVEFAQQLAHRVADTHDLIVIEALRIGNMTRSAKGTVEAPGRNVAQKAGLNRVILDKGWYGFELALRNQARRTGSMVMRVPAAFTSQRCAACGHVASASRESQARFRCVACGHIAHADVNAAINIRELGTAGWAGIGRIRPSPKAASTIRGAA